MWYSRLGIQYEPSHHLVVAHTHLGLHWRVAHTHPGVHQLVAHTHPGVHSEALGVPGYHTPLMFLDTDITPAKTEYKYYNSNAMYSALHYG